MAPKPAQNRTCSHPGCKAPGVVQLATGKAFYCFAHKPVGRMK